MRVVQAAPRTSAIQMAILIASVVALDGAVVYFSQKPLIWAATIPALIPLLTPFVLFSLEAPDKSKN